MCWCGDQDWETGEFVAVQWRTELANGDLTECYKEVSRLTVFFFLCSGTVEGSIQPLASRLLVEEFAGCGGPGSRSTAKARLWNPSSRSVLWCSRDSLAVLGADK